MSSTPSSSSPPGTPKSTQGTDDASLILTPRSKIKALLASVSDDSDDDDDAPVTRKLRAPIGSPKPAQAPLFHASLDNSDSDDDDSDENVPMPVARPRGKLASRMMGAGRAPDSTKPARKSTPLESSGEEAPSTAPKSRRTKRSSLSATSSRSSPNPKPKSFAADASDVSSDEDLPTNLLAHPKFKALIEKKRKEREEKEAEERRLKAEKRKQTAAAVMALHDHGGEEDDVNDIINDENEEEEDGETIRPRRKAGKKAIEEMQRETQRIQRNMQLAHQAKPRKKITKQSLFDKFNFNPDALNGIASSAPAPEPASQDPNPTVIPATPVEQQPALKPTPPVQKEPFDSDDDMLDIQDIFADLKNASKKLEPEVILETQPTAETPKKTDKGKSRAPPSPGILKLQGKGKSTPTKPKPGDKISLPIRLSAPTEDSGDDLEIVGNNKNDPEKERLRLIAEKEKLIASIRPKRKVVAPARGKEQIGRGKQDTKKLYQQLLAKSRSQAVQEKEERIAELRSKGVIIQTAEEREKEQNEIEDLMEKARLEALEIKRREQKEAKLIKGEILDSEDDDDWAESEIEDDGGEDESEIEYPGSGSESETNTMLDDAAAQLSGTESETSDLPPSKSKPSKSTTASPATSRISDFPDFPSDHDSDTTTFDPVLKRKLARQRLRITDDDDDEDDDFLTETPKSRPITPAKDDIPDIFKNPAMNGPTPMGMTQLFAAGSMGATQTQLATSTASLDALRKGPVEELPNSQAPGAGMDFVPDTQLEPAEGGNNLTLQYGSQTSEESDIDNSLPPMQFDIPSTQDIPDPTQDGGFEDFTTPAPPRFRTLSTENTPMGTVATIKMGEGVMEGMAKPARRKGRLVRKIEDSDADEDDENEEGIETQKEEEEKEEEEAPKSQDEDVFKLMKSAAKKKRHPEPKPVDTAEMREMFEDAAIESDDEYAGLGGLSDDDMDANDADALDEVMRDLVDDTNTEHLDEDQLAAFYLAREKAKDEKDVAKLFRDIQHGLLRKKRRAGDDLGLDDSDDEYLVQERRRRLKRRQMAEVRRMLLKDTKVERIAKDPKKSAFWKVLEDEEEASDEDFLDKDEADLYAGLEESQSQVPESGTPAESGSGTQTPAELAPPGVAAPAVVGENPRRTGARLKKPQHLSEIRQTLSFLTEDNTGTTPSFPSYSSDSDSDIEITDAPAAPAPRAAPVIDRTLSRSSTSQSTLSKMAFATGKPGASAADDMPGFRLPPTLLRRATTGLSTASSGSGESQLTEREMAEAAVKGGAGQAVKVGGGNKSRMSVNFRKLKDREKDMRGGEESKGRGRGRERRRGGLLGVGGGVGGGKFE